MATTYISGGNTVDYTAGGSAITSGQVVLIGTRVGVAKDAIAANSAGVLHVTGVWSAAKLSSDVVTQGAALYWDNTNSRFTLTSAGNTLAGWAFAAAGNGVTTVQIKLLG